MIAMMEFFRGMEGRDSSHDDAAAVDADGVLEHALSGPQRAGRFRPAFDPHAMAIAIRAANEAGSPQLALDPDLGTDSYARKIVTVFDRATRAHDPEATCKGPWARGGLISRATRCPVCSVLAGLVTARHRGARRLAVGACGWSIDPPHVSSRRDGSTRARGVPALQGREGSAPATREARMPGAVRDTLGLLGCVTIHYYPRGVEVVAQVKLLPEGDGEASAALGATLSAMNEACNWVSKTAWEVRKFSRSGLHKLCYHDVWEGWGPSAKASIHATRKVADAYEVGRECLRRFRPQGAVTFDDRVLSWNLDARTVSIWTLAGRRTVPFVAGGRQLKLVSSRKGGSDLVHRDGMWSSSPLLG